MYHCHVCGAPVEEAPWGEDGRTPLFDLCPCCGCEFGYEDSTQAGVERYRTAWLQGGGVWKNSKDKPAGLHLEQQLKWVPAKLPIGIARRIA
ncbi:hypothetical protein EYF70_14960 [Pseudoduganella albidiflava]|nr:hypothetical protein EYF70_14960 [Pseudoduganella albidiflava]